MSTEPSPNIATKADVAMVRDISIGNLDAIIAIAITLPNAGLVERVELVKQLDFALDVQRQRDGDSHPGSRYAL